MLPDQKQEACFYVRSVSYFYITTLYGGVQGTDRTSMAERPMSARDSRRESAMVTDRELVLRQTEAQLNRLLHETPADQQKLDGFKSTVKLLKREIERLGGTATNGTKTRATTLQRTESTPTLPRIIAVSKQNGVAPLRVDSPLVTSTVVATASPRPAPEPSLPMSQSAPSSGIRMVPSMSQGGAKALSRIGASPRAASSSGEQYDQALRRMVSTMNGPGMDRQMEIVMRVSKNSFCKRGWRCWLRDGCGAMTGCNETAPYYDHDNPIRPTKPSTQQLWFCLMTFFDHCDKPYSDVKGMQAYSALQLQRVAFAWCATQSGDLLPKGYPKRSFPRGLFLMAAAYRHYLKLELVESEHGPDLPVYINNDSLALTQLRSKSMLPELLELEPYELVQQRRIAPLRPAPPPSSSGSTLSGRPKGSSILSPRSPATTEDSSSASSPNGSTITLRHSPTLTSTT